MTFKIIKKAICLFSLLGQSAYAAPCYVTGPRYNLSGDTVDWSMKIESGQTCVHGLRFGNVDIETVKLISMPESGQVTLRGPGLYYAAKADFRGQDSFTLMVSGAVGKRPGSSTIHIAVSIAEPAKMATAPRSTDITPPSISFIAPASHALVSGSSVSLTATASDDVAVADVQFIIDSAEKIGPPISTAPYTTIWNSTDVSDGIHTLYAVARDTSGNYGTSSITITVKNNVQH